jgi:glycosyltransferase involved in cell wall biosynthesis
MQKYFKDTYNRETKYIPNGIGETTVREPVLISEKYHLEKDGYILFLARIVPEKGLHYLLEAFQKVDTDKKLVIAGQPSHTNDYYNIIKDMAGKDSRIIFTGFVEGQEMEELFSNCCLYILPSDVEGMPISLLEAMSYGCTCLVSDIEENKEVIREYSNYFKRGDVSALKQELEKCLQQEKNSEIMEKRNEYIKSNFSWTNIVNETLELYSCYYSPGVKSKI